MKTIIIVLAYLFLRVNAFVQTQTLTPAFNHHPKTLKAKMAGIIWDFVKKDLIIKLK